MTKYIKYISLTLLIALVGYSCNLFNDDKIFNQDLYQVGSDSTSFLIKTNGFSSLQQLVVNDSVIPVKEYLVKGYETVSILVLPNGDTLVHSYNTSNLPLEYKWLYLDWGKAQNLLVRLKENNTPTDRIIDITLLREEDRVIQGTVRIIQKGKT